MTKQQIILALQDSGDNRSYDVLDRYKESELVELLPVQQITEAQAKSILTALRVSTGASYSPVTNTLNPTKGYMIALQGYEKTVPYVWNTIDLQHVINQWLREKHVLSLPTWLYIGVWENDGKLFLDLAQNFNGSKERAIALGKAREQIAIYDCVNKCDITIEYAKIDADIITDKLY